MQIETETKKQSYLEQISKERQIVIFFIIFLGFIYLILADINLSKINRLYVVVCYLISTFSIFFPIYSKKESNLLPLYPLANVYFLLCYISYFFFVGFEAFENSYSKIQNDIASEILLLGQFFFSFAYFSSSLIFKKNKKEINYLSFSIEKNFYFGLLIMTFTIVIFYLIGVQKYFPGLSFVKYPLLLLGYGLIFNNLILNYKNNSLLIKTITTILLITPIVFHLLYGSYAFPFLLIFLLFVYYYYLTKKLFFFPFLIIVVCFFILHLGKNNYRALTWNGKTSSELYKINIFVKSHKETLQNKLGIKNYSYTLRRIAHSFESLIVVTSQSPENINRTNYIGLEQELSGHKYNKPYVNYWNGYSYKILTSKLVPRLFWKNKPSDTLGNDFGHRYNMLTNTDFGTSWNMPVLNEFFVNFGKKGVIIGMFVLGLLFRFLSKFFYFKNKLNIESTISFFIFVPLFFLESHFSLLFGGVIQSYIFLIIISILFYIITKLLIKFNDKKNKIII